MAAPVHALRAVVRRPPRRLGRKVQFPLLLYLWPVCSPASIAAAFTTAGAAFSAVSAFSAARCATRCAAAEPTAPFLSTSFPPPTLQAPAILAISAAAIQSKRRELL